MWLRHAAIIPNLPEGGGRRFQVTRIPEADIKRNIAMLLSAAFIIGISVLGGRDGIDGITDNGTALQRSVPIASVIYAACGIIAGVGVLLKRAWSFPLAILWAIAAAYTGSVASVAWAETGQPVLMAFAGALVGCIVICGLVLWGVRIAIRTPR